MSLPLRCGQGGRTCLSGSRAGWGVSRAAPVGREHSALVRGVLYVVPAAPDLPTSALPIFFQGLDGQVGGQNPPINTNEDKARSSPGHPLIDCVVTPISGWRRSRAQSPHLAQAAPHPHHRAKRPVIPWITDLQHLIVPIIVKLRS